MKLLRGISRAMFRFGPKSFLGQSRSAEIKKFRRVTIRGAQPSARLSEEICLSEGSAGVSQSPKVLQGLSEGSAGLCGGARDFRGFSGVVTYACDPRELLEEKPP